MDVRGCSGKARAWPLDEQLIAYRYVFVARAAVIVRRAHSLAQVAPISIFLRQARSWLSKKLAPLVR